VAQPIVFTAFGCRSKTPSFRGDVMTLRAFKLLIAGLGLAVSLDFVVIAGAAPAPDPEGDFAPNAQNDPETCKALWGSVGLRRDTRTGRDTIIVCHPLFVLLHDNKLKTPDWVLEKLTKQQVSGSNSRPNVTFKPDPRVPPHGRANDDDYPPKASGFAR